jgi:hypothetical protein
MWFNDKKTFVNVQGSLRRYSGPIMIIHRRGVSVMSGVFSNPKGITLKGSMTCKMVLVHSELSEY